MTPKYCIFAFCALLGVLAAQGRSSHHSHDHSSGHSHGHSSDRAAVLEELKNRTEHYQEGCFPRPTGCMCIVGHDDDGKPIKDRREVEDDCLKRNTHHTQVETNRVEEERRLYKRWARDKVREKAKSNYDKVVAELNERFRDYKENCFPRPRGCLCVVGKGPNGQELTKRIKNDAGCKNKRKPN